MYKELISISYWALSSHLRENLWSSEGENLGVEGWPVWFCCTMAQFLCFSRCPQMLCSLLSSSGHHIQPWKMRERPLLTTRTFHWGKLWSCLTKGVKLPSRHILAKVWCWEKIAVYCKTYSIHLKIGLFLIKCSWFCIFTLRIFLDFKLFLG